MFIHTLSKKNQMIDDDLEGLSVDQLKAEIRKLRCAIRYHRDATSHNLCWYVPELWNVLPERVEPVPEVPPEEEFLHHCRLYDLCAKKTTTLVVVDELAKSYYI